VTEDSADPQKMVEWFMVESWAEHLRQHRRVSNADADLQGELLTYHKGPGRLPLSSDQPAGQSLIQTHLWKEQAESSPLDSGRSSDIAVQPSGSLAENYGD
jgi:hypothetical protein